MRLLAVNAGSTSVKVTIVDGWARVASFDTLGAGLAGAGLDVYATEPLPADSPLLTTPNTLLTPHSASVSERSAHRLSHWTIGDAIEYLASGSVTNGSMVVQPAD